MQSRNLLDELKFQITNGKVTVRLILINLAVFILLMLSFILNKLNVFEFNLINAFRFPTNLAELGFKPWTLLCAIFTHFSLNHFFFNMLFLFFSGLMFEQLFGGRKLIYLYLLGGIVGNLLELLSTLVMPDRFPSHYVVGASGSIMAIFTAIAIYRPKTPVLLLGIVPIPIYILALFFLVKDLVGLGSKDEIAHFAHLGGALMGFLSQLPASSKHNLLSRLSNLGSRDPSKRSQQKRFKTDEEYNQEKMNHQEKTDKILDKIAKSGYDSLSRQEKEFLFKQGQK
ncbi:MAG: rhomboid family intramembrane serine protease [Bacteroidetes bacterium]|nr:rhomboid family intramembrane serine protease [Bacteroidota bacterium]